MIRQERINGMQKQVSACIAQAYERGFKDGMEEHERREREHAIRLEELAREMEIIERNLKAKEWTYPQCFKECDRECDTE